MSENIRISNDIAIYIYICTGADTMVSFFNIATIDTSHIPTRTMPITSQKPRIPEFTFRKDLEGQDTKIRVPLMFRVYRGGVSLEWCRGGPFVITRPAKKKRKIPLDHWDLRLSNGLEASHAVDKKTVFTSETGWNIRIVQLVSVISIFHALVHMQTRLTI